MSELEEIKTMLGELVLKVEKYEDSKKSYYAPVKLEFTGAYYEERIDKWRVRALYHGVQEWLGSYQSKEDAKYVAANVNKLLESIWETFGR